MYTLELVDIPGASLASRQGVVIATYNTVI